MFRAIVQWWPVLACIASVLSHVLCRSEIPFKLHFILFLLFRHDDKTIPELLSILVSRDKPLPVAMGAARCLTFLHRAGALPADDARWVYYTVMLCCISTMTRHSQSCCLPAWAATSRCRWRWVPRGEYTILWWYSVNISPWKFR